MIFKLKRFFLFAALSLVCLLTLSSCYGAWNFWDPGNDVDKRTQKLTRLTAQNDSDFAAAGISELKGKYTVLVISDAHFGNKKKDINTKALYDFLDKLKKESPEKYPKFMLSLGDSVDIGFSEFFEKYKSFCDTLEKDYGISLILNSCVNHDIYQNNWENWEKTCYPHTSFYKFKTDKISWYCLDTASGALGLNQYKILKQDIENDSRPKIIFTHYPFVRFNYNCSNMAETTERNLMISTFYKNKVICLLGGHNHTRTFDDLGFPDYGIPSFGYDQEWGLLFVDEDAASARLEYYK